MEIRIGTSGYSFDDWRGNFYPAGINRGKMLDHYANYYDTTEINSTYYRIPHPAVMYNMVKKTKPTFDFTVKVNQNMTHERKDIEKPTAEFLESVRPISDRGQLHGLLAQFPYSFKYSPPNLDYLKRCHDLLFPHRMFIEFRHDSWLRRDVFAFLKERNIGYVSVDGPRLRGLLPPDLVTTIDTAYIRLHGRNAEKWWDGGADRYDYLYNDDELEEWKKKIEDLQDRVKKTYIFFNNCHLGQAVKNARQMKQKLSLL
jgi:uncharacterized protein YecE (DUF72 family)